MRKIYLKSLFIASAVSLLILASCGTNQQKIAEIQDKVASVKQQYAPDKRVVAWNFEVNEQTLTLSGESSSAQAIEALKTALGDKAGKLTLLPDSSVADGMYAIISNSAGNIRTKPKHSAELATQALFGTPVKVLKQVWGWRYVQTPDNYLGWIDGGGLAQKTAEEMEAWKKLNKVLYAKQSGFIYQEALAESAVESDVILGCLLSITEEKNGFYAVQYPDKRTGFVKKDECNLLTNTWINGKYNSDDLKKVALGLKGLPYLWGGTSAKALDCSGFTKTIYFMNGIVLQRDASQQTNYGELVNTTENYDALMPGDLLFFGRKATANKKERIVHVGMFIGGQHEFIHASGKVRINSLDSTQTHYAKAYERDFVRARRMIGQEGTMGIQKVTNNKFYNLVLNTTQE